MADSSRFLPIISSEISLMKYPFPPELITALIWVESRGNVGAVNSNSGASGLMQIMPIALRHYNQESGLPTVTMAMLKSKSDEYAQDQIRVGMWLLANFWKGAYRFLKSKMNAVNTTDVMKIGDTFYAAGPGRMKQLISKIDGNPTFANIVKTYPNSNAIKHAKNVFNRASKLGAKFDENKIRRWLTNTPVPQTAPTIAERPPIDGAIMALIAIGIVWFTFQKGTSDERKG